MALSDVTVTFSLTQLLGEAFDTRRTRAYVKTNVANGTLMDTSTGKIRMGDQKVTVAADGTGSFTTWAPGVDGNPTSWQTSLVVEYPRTGQRDRTVRTFGPYTITATADLADLEEEQAVPAEYLTTVTAQLDEKVAEAETARTGAEAARTGAETARAGAEAARDTATEIALGEAEAAFDGFLAARDLPADGTALSASIDGARIPALTGKTGQRTGYQDATGLYMHSTVPTRKINNWVARAKAGLEPFKVLIVTDSIWTGFGAYPEANSPYYGEFRPPIIARDMLRSRFDMPVLTGVRFTDTVHETEDDTVSYPVGVVGDWVKQNGFGPAGHSGFRSTSNAARVQLTFNESDPFDQFTIHYFTVHPGSDVFVYSLDGAAEVSVNAGAQTYFLHSVTVDLAEMANSHTITLGMPEAETGNWPIIIGVQPGRSTNDYIEVTCSAKGGAQSYTYANTPEYETQGRFFRDILQPHLLVTNLGVNDVGPPPGIGAVTPTDYATYLTYLADDAILTGGIAVLQSMTPINGEAASQVPFVEKLYDIADALPDSVIVSDLFAEWGDWANFPDPDNGLGNTAANWYDGVHPARGLMHNMVGHGMKWARLASVGSEKGRKVQAATVIRKSGNITLNGVLYAWLPVHADFFLEVDCEIGEAVEVYLGADAIPTSGPHFFTLNAALVDENDAPIRWFSHDATYIPPGTPDAAYAPWFIGPTADYDSRISGSLTGYPRPGELVNGKARVGLFFTGGNSQTANLRADNTFPVHFALKNIGHAAPPIQS